MRLDELVALTKAGFTKDDISRMTAAAQEPAPAPAQETAPAPAPAQETAPAPAQETAQPLTYEQLHKEMQSLALMFAGGSQPKTETLDDVLANIIAPKGDSK